tara:strand:+ start:300 stop:569 length:270 start_codon:yes stop_codon:yes gene_type:complete
MRMDVGRRGYLLMDYLSPGSSGYLPGGPTPKAKPKPTPKGIGLGDVVAAITKATGIAAITKAISKKTGRDCGCNKRRAALNRHRIHVGK